MWKAIFHFWQIIKYDETVTYLLRLKVFVSRLMWAFPSALDCQYISLHYPIFLDDWIMNEFLQIRGNIWHWWMSSDISLLFCYIKLRRQQGKDVIFLWNINGIKIDNKCYSHKFNYTLMFENFLLMLESLFSSFSFCFSIQH